MNADFQRGLAEFNQGNFYACHDTLEAIWMEAEPSERNFYQGILQIAVACYHLENANWHGAVILLGEGTYRLRAYLPTHAGLQLDRFHATSCQLLQELQQLSPEALVSFLDAGRGSELPRPQIIRMEAAAS